MNMRINLIILFCCCIFSVNSAFFKTNPNTLTCRVHRTYSHNLCFFQIPKNASSEITETFKLLHRRNYDPSFKNYFIHVICVRNPLYRIISSYFEILKLRHNAKTIIKSDFYKYRNQDPIKSFRLFLRAIKNGFFDLHLTPQNYYLKSKNLHLQDMDFIIIFENLAQDFAKFCQKFNIPQEEHQLIPIHYSPVDKKQLLQNFVDTNIEAQKIIHEIYKEDFDFYNEALEISKTKNIEPPTKKFLCN